MKVLVICNNGNSSSVMAQKMQKQAKADGTDHIIEAIPPHDAKARIGEYDVILIAPQIKFDLPNYRKIHPKVEVIPALVFGTMDAKKGLALAEEVFNR